MPLEVLSLVINRCHIIYFIKKTQTKDSSNHGHVSSYVLVVQTSQPPFNSLIEFGNQDRRRLTHSVVSPHSGQDRNKARMRYGDSQQKRIVYAVHGLILFIETINRDV